MELSSHHRARLDIAFVFEFRNCASITVGKGVILDAGRRI